MKILTIGSFFDHDFSDNAYFSSSISFLDYDIVLIDFRYILSEYKSTSSGTYKGYKCLNDDDSVALLEDMERRKLEILEILKLGRTVIVYTPSPQICYVDTGKREYSGTGRNRQTTRIVSDVNLLSVLPIKIKTIEASGTSIDFRGDDPFATFWSQNKKLLSFAAYFQEPVGKPLWFVRGTDKAIGSYLPLEKGNLIFLPAYSDDDEDENDEKDFLQSIKRLVEELKKNTGDFRLPSWCSDFLLPEEDAQRSKLKKHESELKKITNTISKQKKNIAELEEYKILFSGTGRALEVQVGKVLSEIGFEVTEGLPGRDDLILKYRNKVAVVEVKGVSKSAAEKHAAQLEKWVSEYISSKGIIPKGMLIVNAFKDTPLTERTEHPFSPQMITYSTNRNHCLLTGTQLLGIYLYSKDNPEKRDEIVEQLFATDGLFELYSDWTSFIKGKGEIIEAETK